MNKEWLLDQSLVILLMLELEVEVVGLVCGGVAVAANPLGVWAARATAGACGCGPWPFHLLVSTMPTDGSKLLLAYKWFFVCGVG